ncbi:hypothetical protein ALC57_14395 [Trachymyrmex cornetzi]|uniref:Uncharacterized protein n=1 Tax=Trachymyrmex cornetzi TaxID=471704 RepID=A0A195DKL8_9HYME|nr:hypothetical protein ALC57_14395 [Trachymyrmex cornetzi]
MVKQGRELSLFVEQTFADDTAGHWCLARSGPWYKSVRTTGGGLHTHMTVRFTDIYEICRYCSSSNPIILLRSNKAFSVILQFRDLTSNWHTPETDETSAVLRGVADRRRETDDSLIIHRPPVTSAYLITTSNCE